MNCDTPRCLVPHTGVLTRSPPQRRRARLKHKFTDVAPPPGTQRHHPKMDLCNLGHIARTEQLRAAGYTRAEIAHALASGAVRRLQRGTYVCGHLDGALLDAALMGGALTCVSVLREHEVWAGHDRRVHVQVSPRASTPVPRGVRAHRELARYSGTALRVAPLEALRQAMRCLDGEDAIAAMESALHKNFLSEAEVRRLGALAPRRL